MSIDFVQYLKRKKTQEKIDDLASKYVGKKVFLFGAGNFANAILSEYDFSKLDIIGVADKSFENNYEGDFFGYTKYSPYDMLENDFDLVLVLAYDFEPFKEYLKKLFEGEETKFDIKPVISMNVFEYFKYMFLK